MMGNDLVARERISRLMREAEAERLARPLVEARSRARRERIGAHVLAIRAAFSKRKAAAVEPVIEA
jgi:hypothetical protein